MKEYKKLNRYEEYDQAAAEELAEALTELNGLRKRAAFLEELVSENKPLHDFVWSTAEGTVIALHKLEDDHLENILKHLVDTGRTISKSIKAEARKRGLEVPNELHASQRFLLSKYKQLADVGRDDEKINLLDIPF